VSVVKQLHRYGSLSLSINHDCIHNRVKECNRLVASSSWKCGLIPRLAILAERFCRFGATSHRVNRHLDDFVPSASPLPPECVGFRLHRPLLAYNRDFDCRLRDQWVHREQQAPRTLISTLLDLPHSRAEFVR